MIRTRASKDAEVFDNALAGRGSRNSDVQQLVRFAESLCEAAAEPAADFVLRLRAELMADASSVLVVAHKPDRTVTSPPVTHPVRKRLTVATVGVLATAGMLGIVASSAQALPGDMLYPVKRGVESVELTLHRSDAGRGSFQLTQATERLAEAQTLATEGSSRTDGLVVKSLSDFSAMASAGANNLFADYTSGGGNASIDKVNSFATAAGTVLSGLSGYLSPGDTEAFRLAVSTVTDLASQASALCSECQGASLTSLAKTVAALIGDTRDTGDTNSAADQLVSPDSKSPTSPTGTITPAVPKVPTVSPVPTLPPTVLDTGTDPLIGTLLGDDGQTTPTPGPLDSLLGGG